jgi:hypothetical protein
MAARLYPDHRGKEKSKRVKEKETMLGTLFFVVFYLNLKVPSFDAGEIAR